MNQKLDVSEYKFSKIIAQYSSNGWEILETLIAIHFDIKVFNLQSLLYCIRVSSKWIYRNQLNSAMVDFRWNTTIRYFYVFLLKNMRYVMLLQWFENFNLRGPHFVIKKYKVRTKYKTLRSLNTPDRISRSNLSCFRRTIVHVNKV